MRIARILITGALLTGTLTLAAPAYASAVITDAWDQGSGSGQSWNGGQDGRSSDNGYQPQKGGGWKGDEGGNDNGQKSWNGGGGRDTWKPRGGMHTGGGGMAATQGGGLAAGAVLLLGGLGTGAYILRRRARVTPAV
jgi:hypothetical protein